MSKNFKIGDLVTIVSSFTGEAVPDSPAGIIIEISKGYPQNLEKNQKERNTVTLFWQNGIEKNVDEEWLLKIKSLSD
jgi:hypothetical protein